MRGEKERRREPRYTWDSGLYVASGGRSQVHRHATCRHGLDHVLHRKLPHKSCNKLSLID